MITEQRDRADARLIAASQVLEALRAMVGGGLVIPGSLEAFEEATKRAADAVREWLDAK